MVYLYRGGCLLPFLIFFNLFFGRIFFNFKLWLIIEGVLILIFLLYSYILSKKLLSGVNNLQKRSGVIDVEAEVVDKNKDKGIE